MVTNTLRKAKLIDIQDGESKLAKVESAIRDYHLSLDKRLNGDIAAHECVRKIECALDMVWFPGEELRRRT